MNPSELTQQIPVLSIVFMFLSAAAILFVPFYLYRQIQKRLGADFFCMAAGAAAYVIFGVLGIQLLGGVVFMIPGVVPLLEENGWILGLYYMVITSLTEIVGIFMAVAFLQKKHQGEGRALAFGLGYGGGKAILMAGPAILTNINMAIKINISGLSSVLSKVEPESQGALLEALGTLLKGSSFDFLWIGIEQSVFTFFYCLAALLIWMFLYKKLPVWFVPVVFLLFFGLLLPFVLFSYGVFKEQWHAMAVFLMIAAGALFVGGWLVRRYHSSLLGILWKS